MLDASPGFSGADGQPVPVGCRFPAADGPSTTDRGASAPLAHLEELQEIDGPMTGVIRVVTAAVVPVLPDVVVAALAHPEAAGRRAARRRPHHPQA